MQHAADRTAKRLSAEEWFVRYDLCSPAEKRASPSPAQRPPADRIALRA
jgi:hypothetical protein